MHHGSKAVAILKLWEDGKSTREIAGAVQCSKANVVQTIRRHGTSNITVLDVHFSHRKWLEREARRTRTTVGIMARAMLADAINEAMDEE